jgi:small subunit ribosomal protein S4e
MIKVDGKVRREHGFPLGQMDVLTIDKTNEHFRILLDTKGRFQPVRIDAKEAAFKLCKVVKKYIGKNKVPYVVTHDGRSIRFPHPEISKMDSVKVSFPLVFLKIDYKILIKKLTLTRFFYQIDQPRKR